MGGVAVIILLLGMIRTKFAAVLIGASGVGLLASFTAIQGIIGAMAGMGIQSSAVREIAAAVGKNDGEVIGRVVHTLRRVCWLTGLIGMATMFLFSTFISQLTFGSDKYTLDIAALGIVILLTNLSGGQLAIIQGMRRISDMAYANIYGAILATLATIFLYFSFGLRGIVPALISIAAIQLGLSWYFARDVVVPSVTLTWRQSFSEANGMVKIGLVFMWTGLLGSAVSYLTIALITNLVGLQSVGLYSAAFALSGVFINFILNAMGADYYPRLTALSEDKVAVNRLVNQQTEIGLLLAVPGILATIVLAPWIIEVFYTIEFLPAVKLLQWFTLGCLGRVVSWPIGYLIIALGRGRWFFISETSFTIVHLLLVAIFLYYFGIQGVAIAFFLMYIGYAATIYLIARHLTGYSWSSEVKKIIWLTLSALAVLLLILKNMSLLMGSLIGCGLILMSTIYSFHGLIKRTGFDNKLSRVLLKIPGLCFFCGINRQ